MIKDLPGAHILQSREWGEIKRAGGWEPIPRVWKDGSGKIQAAALILERDLKLGRISSGLKIQYVPRGPMLDWNDRELRDRIFEDLQNFARSRKAIMIKIDPEQVIGTGIPHSELAEDNETGKQVVADLIDRGWIFSDEQIQFKNTVVLNLESSEEDWLSRMKPKTRYNLRLSQKKGVSVRLMDKAELGVMYKMYAETSIRDGFVIRTEAYYQRVWRTFMDAGMGQGLVAEADGETIAAIILLFLGEKAWYLYGMSKDIQREKMPNYLLQWEAMRFLKKKNVKVYDLWGAPDEFNEMDSMWGVFRFKEGLGGKVIRTIGAYDFAPNPFMYRVYTLVLPKILDLMRTRGKAKTKMDVN